MHYKSEESNMDTIRSCTTRSCKTFFNEKKQQYSIQDHIKLMRTILPQKGNCDEFCIDG